MKKNVTILCSSFAVLSLLAYKYKNEKTLLSPSVWTRDATNPVVLPDSIPKTGTAVYDNMADPVIIYENNLFKMWYGYGGPDTAASATSVRVRVGYAESSNGVNWTNFKAKVLDVGNDTAWDATGAETPCVIVDQSLPAGNPKKYRLYYAGINDHISAADQLTNGMGYGIGLAYSADGKTFTRIPASDSPYTIEGLVLKPNQPANVAIDMDDFVHIADPHVVFRNNLYHLWYTSVTHKANSQKVGMSIGYATSTDGITWTKKGIVIQPTQAWEKQFDSASIGRPYVLWDNQSNQFEMFYDAIKLDTSNVLENSCPGIGYAVSTDGMNWTKSPNNPIFITNNGAGETKGFIVGCGVVLVNNIYYLYYPGLVSYVPTNIPMCLATSPYIVGVSELFSQRKNVSIFPSVVSSSLNKITVQWEQPVNGDVLLSVLDMNGRVVRKWPAMDVLKGRRDISLSLPALSPGVYFIKIESETTAITEKFIVN